jgi:hypothetical protein
MMAWWKREISITYTNVDRDHSWWRLLPVLALVIGCLQSTGLLAENPAVCPEDNLDECTRYQHLMSGMNSGDLVVELSSLHAASQELDPSLRTLIFGKALKSTDLRLRTAGLRYVLGSRNTFDVVIEQPVHPTPAQEQLYKQYGSLTLRSVKLDEKTDEITAAIYNRVSGSIIRGGFELGWPYCRLHMLAGEEDAIRGTLRCQYPNTEPAELKASIELG